MKHIVFQGKLLFTELLPNEKIPTVQKQHWSVLLLLFISHALVILILCAAITLFIIMKYPSFALVIIIDGTLVLFSLLALLGTYVYMDWYYTFYVITDKRLIIRHFFKIIGGAYYKEIFLQSGTRFEVERISPNIIYDILDIEDVYVKFRNIELTEPFIFERPQHPEEIEKALYAIENY